MANTISTIEHRTETPAIVWPRVKARSFLSVIIKVALLPLQALWLLIFTFPLYAPVLLFIIWLFWE